MNEELKKDTLLLFMTAKEIFDALPDEEAGKLIKAAFKYQDGEEPELDGLLRVVFLQIRQQIDYTNAQYFESVKKRSTAGKKGMAHRWNNKNNNVINVNNKNNNVINVNNKNNKGITNDNKHNHNDNVNDTVNVIVDTLSIEREAPESKNIMIPRETQEEIMQAWNSLGLDQIIKISKKREKALQELIIIYGIDGIHEAIEKVRNAPFLMGEIKEDFRASFDWFLKDDNFLKTLEGAYDEGKGKKRKEDLINDTSGYGEISGMYDGFADSIGRKAE